MSSDLPPVKTAADKKFLAEGGTWQPKHGEHICRFIESHLRFSQGRHAGQLVKLLPWQRNDLIMPLFSWRTKDNTLRYRSGWISTPKKNGKSCSGMWICAAFLLATGEQSPMVVNCANDRGQASILYDDFRFSVERDKQLKRALKITESQKIIRYPAKNGTYRVLSRESSTKHGISASLCVFDEAAFSQDDELYKALRYAGIARQSSLMLCISTAGYDRSTWGYDQYKYAKSILDNECDDVSFFPLVYEASDDPDILDENEWHRANPSLTTTMDIQEIRQAAAAANSSPSAKLNFLSLRLNKWTTPISQYISLDRWDECLGEFPDLTGQPIFLGLDLASTIDLTGLAGVIPYQGKFYLLQHAWVPVESVREQEAENLGRYRTFEQEGSLSLTPGNAADYSTIRKYISQLAEVYDVRVVVCDRSNALETALLLQQDGLEVKFCPQTPAYLNHPTKGLEKIVLDKTLVHDGSELMRWQCTNLQVKTDARNYLLPTKALRSSKIDNFSALIMALGQALQFETTYAPDISPYETCGVKVLDTTYDEDTGY
jgi:phage terminase large subunit-like protein